MRVKEAPLSKGEVSETEVTVDQLGTQDIVFLRIIQNRGFEATDRDEGQELCKCS